MFSQIKHLVLIFIFQYVILTGEGGWHTSETAEKWTKVKVTGEERKTYCGWRVYNRHHRLVERFPGFAWSSF
jgi:hypothetical protein